LGLSTIFVAAGCLVMAQLLGVYALITRKADLVFSIVMVGLLVAAVALGGYGLYHRYH
jgi:hypothetical protein